MPKIKKIANKPRKIAWKKNLSMEEWLKCRQEMEGIGQDYVRIGASDIGCILNENKWKEKRRLMMHLVGDYSQFILTESTIAGHQLEPVIAGYWESFNLDEQTRLFQTHHGIKERKLKKAAFFVLNDAYPNFFVSLDYINSGKQYSPWTGELYHPLTPHEFKSTNKDYYRTWTGGITKSYYSQVQTQLMLTNTPVAVFHTLIDGVNYKVLEIHANPSHQAMIVEEVEKFCDLVKDAKIAFWGMNNAEDPQMREEFREIYNRILPEFEGYEDGVNLADELWEAPDFLDKDAAFMIGDEDDDKMMDDYWNYLRMEETIELEKNKIKANLKLRSSGFEGIKTDNYKLINRATTATKGKYFSIRPINSN